MLTQAASLWSTNVSAIRRASSTEPAVVMTSLLSVIESAFSSQCTASETSFFRRVVAAMPGHRTGDFVKVDSSRLQLRQVPLDGGTEEKSTETLGWNPQDNLVHKTKEVARPNNESSNRAFPQNPSIAAV